jgi:hypothetical protein
MKLTKKNKKLLVVLGLALLGAMATVSISKQKSKIALKEELKNK